MCDTLVALPSVTKNGNLLFAKNSDREPEEAQAIIHLPRVQPDTKYLKCTYLEIPQVTETFECILSKPFQMWGAEMGANEHGLVIGNEAVFTKVKFSKENRGLTGMDLLRLGLERSKNADEAITCITALLEQYGQDVNGGYKNKNFFYHNSFLLADKHHSWILETAGKQWAAKKVKDIHSISNKLSICDADKISANAKSFAQSNGWWKNGTPFSFQSVYSDWFYTRMGRASTRQSCTTSLSRQREGKLSVADHIRILQTHNLDDDHFKPSRANTGSVCMHATSLINPSNTTGSMVAEIRSTQPHTIWLTGSSHPCLSIYVPFFFDTKSMHELIPPSAQQDHSLWWRAEKLHRWIGKDYKRRKLIIETERKAMQERFLKEEVDLLSADSSPRELELFSSQCLNDYMNAIAEWSLHVK